jgi:hypothetical protein
MTSWNQIVSSIERDDADPPRARLIVNTDIPFTNGEATQQLAAAIEKLNNNSCSACGRPGHGADDLDCPKRIIPGRWSNGKQMDVLTFRERVLTILRETDADSVGGKTTAQKVNRVMLKITDEIRNIDIGKPPTTLPTGKELETLETHGVVVPADHLPTILTFLINNHTSREDTLTVLPRNSAEYVVYVRGARDDINALLNTLDSLSL